MNTVITPFPGSDGKRIHDIGVQLDVVNALLRQACHEMQSSESHEEYDQAYDTLMGRLLHQARLIEALKFNKRAQLEQA